MLCCVYRIQCVTGIEFSGKQASRLTLHSFGRCWYSQHSSSVYAWSCKTLIEMRLYCGHTARRPTRFLQSAMQRNTEEQKSENWINFQQSFAVHIHFTFNLISLNFPPLVTTLALLFGCAAFNDDADDDNEKKKEEKRIKQIYERD